MPAFEPPAHTARLTACIHATLLGDVAGKGGLPSGDFFPASLPQLLALRPEALAAVPIARMNLLCAQGLPGVGPINLPHTLSLLDTWAQRAKAETDRHFYRFRRSPQDFERSEGFFRLLMLGVVLAEDFRVHYKESARLAPQSARLGDGFFAEPADVFLCGLLGPKRQGTCSSLPVLYVAVGRRLGYPLKLVTTRGHLFVRWEDGQERFNVEVSGQGLNRFDDAYYRQWPFAITEEEVQAEGYLKSLTPPEELAVFLSIRGMCWLEAGKKAEAATSFRAAARFAPGVRSYRQMADKLEREVGPQPPKSVQSHLEVGRDRWARRSNRLAVALPANLTGDSAPAILLLGINENPISTDDSMSL